MANIKTGKQENKVVAALNNMYDEAKSARDLVSKNWGNFLDYSRGRQWEKGRRSYKSDIVINLIELTLEREKGLLTDTKPTLYVNSRQKSLEGNAKILQKGIQAIWDANDFDQTLMQMISFAGLYGSSGVGITFDPLADNDYGDISLPVIDPRNMLWDPWMRNCRQVDKQCMYSIHETIVPIDIIRARFPGKGKLVEPNKAYSSYMTSEIKTAQRGRGGAVPYKKQDKDKGRTSAFPKACLREYYIFDPTTNETEKDIKMGDMIVRPGMKLFAGGRHIFMAEDVILIDEPNRFWDGKKPQEWYDWRLDTETPWGRSEVEVLINLQKNMNKMASVMIENFISMNNAWIIGDQDAMTPENWNKIRGDAPGLIVKKRPQRDFKRDYPPALPSTGFQIIQLFSQMLEQLSGMSDVGAGKRPTQLASGIAMENLQAQAQVLLRLRARGLENFLQRVFQKVIPRIFQFYTEDRMLQVLGPSEELSQFEFVRKDLLKGVKDPSKAFRDFKFIISPGSSLSMSKMQKAQLALQLFQGGLIDDEAVLETIEYPNAETVLKRAQAKRAQSVPPPGAKGGQKGKKKNQPMSTIPGGKGQGPGG